ncbi:hypothetical protein GCM10010398_32350 [Streptomyces fimbriatus]
MRTDRPRRGRTTAGAAREITGAGPAVVAVPVEDTDSLTAEPATGQGAGTRRRAGARSPARRPGRRGAPPPAPGEGAAVGDRARPEPPVCAPRPPRVPRAQPPAVAAVPTTTAWTSPSVTGPGRTAAARCPASVVRDV